MTAASDRLLRRLEWQVLRRLDGRLQGGHRTVWRGVGIDFADLRAYTPEDDVRHIDWNVTARMDEPFVRQYTEDRELTAWLVLDRSASMRVGGGDAPGKESVLTELAICLARLLSQHGNRVGAILYDNRHQKVIPPRAGRNQILRLAHELDRPVPADGHGATTDLAAMLRLAATTSRRRSLFLVLSDFIGEPGWERALTLLAHRHEVVAVRIVDPAELRLPDLGLVIIEDAETGEQLLVDTGDPLLRRRFRAQAREREAALDGAVTRAGAVAHRVTTDTDLVDALVGMVHRSRRRPR
ncbi:DUF58 domain-containing protein [Catellatospora bangladeshensis]|uniref:DUF58 domain-containing protein n=1 Tax=Catellatospora bangladeshensis TaxID=310355 RepID=A0A8J3JKN9_9ACTN|nr:DUF58 domain-containing protein [Catellatospora bangladeshensis]GIF82252.1 hypothetical protein Cba03nite_36010 [Catellatospora bangladeshensis]